MSTYSIRYNLDPLSSWSVMCGDRVVKTYQSDALDDALESLRKLTADEHRYDGARDAFDLRLSALHRAAQLTSNQVAMLPHYKDAPCGCGVDALRVVEPGYERWSKATVEEEVSWENCDDDDDEPEVLSQSLHAHSNGWSDMGEHGYFEYLLCSTENGGCGAKWQVPEDLDWD